MSKTDILVHTIYVETKKIVSFALIEFGKNYFKMIKKAFYVALASLFLLGCDFSADQPDEQVITARAGVRYGGEFRFMSKEKVSELFPLKTTDQYTQRVAGQIFEGLLKLHPATMEVIPALAESYTISEDARVFTFKLRQNVLFHDNECFPKNQGRLVTAHDFKYSLEFACSQHEFNEVAWLIKDKIKGAEDYYTGEANEVEGIKVISDYEIEIELKTPFISFDKTLTNTALGVFPSEAFDYYGNDIVTNPVGTGAFLLETLTEDSITLIRNPFYWRKDENGNPLPFLDKIKLTYSKNKADELLSFRSEKIDLVMDIPVEEVENVLGTLAEAQAGKNVKHLVDSKTSMSVQYYAFAHEHAIFSKKEVRKAFNIAINRDQVINEWLEGEGWAANNGFVPKMEGYDYQTVRGHEYNVEEAKKLLSKAGYPNGVGFPKLNLYVNANEGSGTHRLAMGVVESLNKNLGLEITIKLTSYEGREKAIKDGNAVFWRAGWIADYPDPENFLNLFYSGAIQDGKTTINPFKYRNQEFDDLFKAAMQETDREKRMELLAKCDQIIIDDAVVMPLVSDDFITMINLRVKNFVTNEMEHLDFSTIFIKEIKH